MAKEVPTGYMSYDGIVYDTPEAAIRADAIVGIARILKKTEDFNYLREVAEYLFGERLEVSAVFREYITAMMCLRSSDKQIIKKSIT